MAESAAVIQYGSLYAAGVGALGVAWIGYALWDLDTTPSALEFIGEYMFIAGCPLALTLYVVVVSGVHSKHDMSAPRRVGFHLLHILLLIAILVASWEYGGYDLLSCGLVFFCFGNVTYGEFEDQPFSGSGKIPTIGAALFVSALVVLLGQFALTLRLLPLLLDAKRPAPGGPMRAAAEGRTGAALAHLPPVPRGFWPGAWFVIVLPALWYLAAISPNSFENWTAVNMKIWVGTNIQNLRTPEQCSTEYTTLAAEVNSGYSWAYPCPEYAGAWLHTTSWRLGQYVYAKNFPDVWIFYLYLYAATAWGVAATRIPRFGRLMRRRPHALRIPACRWLGLPAGYNVLVGQAVFGAMMASALVLILWYWYVEHDFHNFTAKDDAVDNSQRAARTAGQLSSMLLGLLGLPVARNSVWLELFGVSWEGGLALHRLLGRLFLLATLVHMFLWWYEYAEEGGFPADLYITDTNSISSDNFTIAMTTYTFYISLVVFGVLTLGFVRRRHFELFFYAHHFSFVVYIVAIWHATSALYFVLPAIVLFAVDVLLRVWAGTRDVPLLGVVPHTAAGVTELHFAAYEFEPGQFAFLNVPALSALQWHPFTISAAPTDSHVTHHIKAMGADGESFTARLAALATARAATPLAPPLAVRVDGPYGRALRCAEYEDVLFVAGGIGVTPCHAHVRALYHQQAAQRASGARRGGGAAAYGTLREEEARPTRVRLVWAVRDRAVAALFEETLRALLADDLDGRFSLALHLTGGAAATAAEPTPAAKEGSWERRGAAKHASDDALRFAAGRPDVAAELTAMGYPPGGGSADARRALVFVCGPAALSAAADAAAMAAGGRVDFHAETFEL